MVLTLEVNQEKPESEDSLLECTEWSTNLIMEFLKTTYFQEGGVLPIGVWHGNGYPIITGCQQCIHRILWRASISRLDKQEKLWVKYVDNTFIIWTRGRNTVEFLNVQVDSIGFTEENRLNLYVLVLVQRNYDLHNSYIRMYFSYTSVSQSVCRMLGGRIYTLYIIHVIQSLESNGYTNCVLKTAQKDEKNRTNEEQERPIATVVNLNIPGMFKKRRWIGKKF